MRLQREIAGTYYRPGALPQAFILPHLRRSKRQTPNSNRQTLTLEVSRLTLGGTAPESQNPDVGAKRLIPNAERETPDMDTIFTLQGVDLNQLFDATIKWLLGPGLRILLIIIVAFVAIRIGRIFIARSLSIALRDTGKDAIADAQTAKRRTTLTNLFTNVLRVFVVLLIALMLLRELHFEIAPILASAGVLGLAIGIGAQSLVKDLITGAFIVLEHQYSVGDIVKIGDRAGVVENIGLRTTQLRDLEGTAHVIPNGEISVVSVMSKGWSQAVLDIPVAYHSDLDLAMETISRVLNEYAAEAPQNVIAPPEILGIETLGENGITIRSTVRTAPSKQWETSRILRKRLKAAFDKAGVEIPFPQRVLWIRNEGGWGRVSGEQ
jgi:small conductance mechanosensitive channel